MNLREIEKYLLFMEEENKRNQKQNQTRDYTRKLGKQRSQRIKTII